MMNLICYSCGAEVESKGDTCPVCGKCPLLDNRFRLLQVLGRGAMGTTYKAERLDNGALVAVKELPFRQIQSIKTMDLFEREARVLKSLSHSQIPSYYEDFLTGEGKHTTLVIVQEFIDGVTLDEEYRTKNYSEAEVLRDVDDLLGILTYTHSLHPPVIHRDLKPSNIIRRKSDGKLVLIDFWGAKHSLGGGSTIAGTFGYMAPEQYRGEASPASDLYALGVIAVRLLSGKEPEELMGAGSLIEWENAVGNLSPRLDFTLHHLLRKEVKKHQPDNRTPPPVVWVSLALIAIVMSVFAIKISVFFSVVLALLAGFVLVRCWFLFKPGENHATSPHPARDVHLNALRHIQNHATKVRDEPCAESDVVLVPS